MIVAAALAAAAPVRAIAPPQVICNASPPASSPPACSATPTVAPAAAGVPGAPAPGSVAIDGSQIVVTGRAGSAVIDRSPFRMSFRDAAGRTVLREVDNPGAPAPNVVSEQPLNTGRVPDHGFYAPLSLELGGAANTQYPGSSYGGNLMLAGRAGIFLVPTAVTSAAPFGSGVRMEVATQDPLHSIAVTVTPDVASGIRVQAQPTDSAGVVAMSDSFATNPGEAFHGFGGRHNGLDERGQSFYDWVEQENITPGQLKPLADFLTTDGNHYLFPNGPTAAYYVQNEFVSSHGYGFMLNQTELSRWRLASDRPDAWQVAVDAPAVDYTVATGNAPQAIQTLTAIGGRQPPPPSWAQGSILLRGVQVLSANSDNAQTYQAKVERDLAKIDSLCPRVRTGRKPACPIDAYAYEGWAGLPEDFDRHTNADLLSRGIKPMGYMRAFVEGDGIFETQATFDQALVNGYGATTAAGTPYVFPVVEPSLQLDFTNPATVAWWDGRLQHMLDLGFEGFMQDFGEATFEDMHFHDGATGHTMHNRYPILYHEVTREFVRTYEAAHPGRHIWFYTRSGFGGRPGSAAYEGGNFAGDGSSDYDLAAGLPSQTTDMLNRAVGGAFGFTTDIGGYLDNQTADGQPLTAELFTRWAQWAALTPFFRVHNSCCSVGTRMPWDFGDATYRRWVAMADLHRRAAPYIRSLWLEGDRDGMPPTRPLWLAAPGDGEAAMQEQEWMLGTDVLVAPVVTKAATSRRVYFPAGCWRDQSDGASYNGGRYATVPAPIDALPYFFRCGTRPF